MAWSCSVYLRTQVSVVGLVMALPGLGLAAGSRESALALLSPAREETASQARAEPVEVPVAMRDAVPRVAWSTALRGSPDAPGAAWVVTRPSRHISPSRQVFGNGRPVT
jgi:hypothetical protein